MPKITVFCSAPCVRTARLLRHNKALYVADTELAVRRAGWVEQRSEGCCHILEYSTDLSLLMTVPGGAHCCKLQ